MTLRVIRPAFANVEAVFPKLVSSDFVETFDGALWSNAVAYAVGQRAYVSGSVHKLYECLVANTNQNPPSTIAGATTGTIYWAEVTYTNPYRMFDTVNSSVSTATGPSAKSVVFDPGRINSIFIGNIDGVTSIDVAVSQGATTVYSRTVSLASSNVVDWYDYWFEPILMQNSMALFDLPPIGVARVTLTFHGGGTMTVGTVQCGLSREMGEVQWQPSVRHLDFSTYKQDTFGNIKITPRVPALVVQAKVFVPRLNGSFDDVNRQMADLTGQIVTWSFQGDKYPSMNILGFKNDFDHVLDSSAGSFFNLKVQGLI
ncbi:hypothetical protein AB4Z19_15620 [Pseudoduganella sp. RAF19]|uniref:hypothetical protein n=1 Tax=Bacteria TaxID=2 RepID=UPI003F9E4601